jgi:hypothetical protein
VNGTNWLGGDDCGRPLLHWHERDEDWHEESDVAWILRRAAQIRADAEAMIAARTAKPDTEETQP